MLLLLLVAAGLIVVKKGGVIPLATPALKTGNAVAATAGTAPSNGMPASPTPVASLANADGTPIVATDVEDDDLGGASGMDQTAAMTQDFQGSDDTVGAFDTNETQSSSGMDNQATDSWRPPVVGQRWNRILTDIWSEAMDVDYLSPSPSVQFQFQPPPVTRQDNNPIFNRQSWARSQAFQGSDPTQVFESDSYGIPSADQDGDDLEEEDEAC